MVLEPRRAAAVNQAAVSRAARIAPLIRLMSIGAVVCISFAGCGGHDDSAAQDSSATSNAATPQSDSTTVANTAIQASGTLAPPVMHYAQ